VGRGFGFVPSYTTLSVRVRASIFSISLSFIVFTRLGRLNPNSLKNIRIQAAQKEGERKRREERKRRRMEQAQSGKIGKKKCFWGKSVWALVDGE